METNIVVVEDEAPIREGMAKILSKINTDYKVVGTAVDGEKGLELIRKEQPDLVIMDIRMPHMDGLEATRRIRSMERPDAGKIPIIAMTADAFAEDRQRSLQAGMNAHLSKPLEPDILYRTILRHI